MSETVLFKIVQDDRTGKVSVQFYERLAILPQADLAGFLDGAISQLKAMKADLPKPLGKWKGRGGPKEPGH